MPYGWQILPTGLDFPQTKSAPKEFREVQSLLFSLQAALTLLDEVVKLRQTPSRAESSAAGNDEESIKTLLMIVKNCRDVLEDLEKLQKEYLVPDKSADSSRRLISREHLRR